ncbi:hypothetical protein [Desulfomonile tiedjei]|uniref:Uncharacterized protein n=1 Tax=Desulfomonile tiedjei (strain ATCC 49306 / DSM 6799 / DCB-1) TaxID=706587 RepID=I4CCD2_DESTA|nr:hypothetical protein [Desulfomonile tiedjei]AFM27223.1 hypothetical protein Desti_4597 [Desulfomonile tiedjei DSM 6799]
MFQGQFMLEQLEERIVLDGAVADVQDVQDQTSDANSVDSLGWVYVNDGWWYEDTGSGWWFNENSGWWWNENDGWWLKSENGFDFWYRGEHQYWANEISTGLWFWWDDIDEQYWEPAFKWFADQINSEWTWVYNDWNGTFYQTNIEHYYYEDHATGDRWQWNSLSSIWKPIPSLVADINAGDYNSFPEYMTVYNGQLYFAADGDSHGEELWRYDSATNTVSLVADLYAGYIDSDPHELTVYNGELYFAADRGLYETELWKYNSVSNTLTFVADIHPNYGSNPQFLTVYNGALYFAATDGVHGNELWKYDSTSNTASLVADIRPNSDSDPAHLTVYNGQLYFIANDGTHGDSLWRYDSASNVTTLVTDHLWRGGGLIVYHNQLYFSAYDAGPYWKYDLWRYDSVSGSVLAAGRNPSFLFPCNLTVCNDQLYFQATGALGDELWKYDWVTQSASLVADIYPGDGHSNPGSSDYWQGMVEYRGQLYFPADDGAHGIELWKYDPQSNTATLVYDLREGMYGSYLLHLVVYDDELYFCAYDDIHGRELWKYHA